jgi:hypothetical protein
MASNNNTFFSEPRSAEDLPPPLLLRDLRHGSPYPIWALPDIIKDAVEEVIQLTQAPEALVAGSALATVSASLQDLVSVQRNEQLVGPVGLFLLTVARSGERKSTVDRLLGKAVRDWEAEQVELARPSMVQFTADFKNWEAIDAGLRDAQRKCAREGSPDDGLADRIAENEALKPREPRVPSIVRGDDTPEAFAAALEKWPVAFVLNAEAGLVFGGPGMNQDSVMRNLSQFNVAWDGGHIRRARTTGQNVDVQGMRVAVCLQVQPEVLANFMQKCGPLAKGIGFMGRILMCEPQSTQGSRMYEPPAEGTPALSAFNARVRQLLSVERRFDQHGQLSTFPMPFNALAQRAWEEFYNMVEEQLGQSGRYMPIQEMASKAAENAARIACCLHVFAAQGDQTTVGPESMLAATDLMKWYLEEALRVLDQTILSKAVLDAEALEEWLAERILKRLQPTVQLIEICQKGPPGTRLAKERDAALEVLDSHNRVLFLKSAKRSCVTLSPEVFKQWKFTFDL